MQMFMLLLCHTIIAAASTNTTYMPAGAGNAVAD
jgi:hypothetical protein